MSSTNGRRSEGNSSVGCKARAVTLVPTSGGTIAKVAHEFQYSWPRRWGVGYIRPVKKAGAPTAAKRTGDLGSRADPSGA